MVHSAKRKKLLILLLTAAAILCMGTVFFASVAPSLPEKEVFCLTESRSENRLINGIKDKSAVKNLKSSKPSVAKVSLFQKGKEIYLDIKLKKPGKTTISCDVDYKGETIHLESRVRIKKYTNPFKKLMVGSVNYAPRFAKNTTTGMWGRLQGKLSIQLKSGYKIKKIEKYSYADGSGYKELKRGKNINVRPGYRLQITVMDKKDKDEQVFSFNME